MEESTVADRLWLFYRNIKNTVQYLEVFSRFKQKETIEAVERVLHAQDKLEPFERSQLGMAHAFSQVESKSSG
jgi:DNA-directed RNA polymerase II subunit RPB4